MPRKPVIAPRKPPNDSSIIAAAERFVRAERPDVQTSKRPARRRTTVYLGVETFRSLSVRCASEEREMSEAVEEAVSAWLAR